MMVIIIIKSYTKNEIQK